MVNTEFIGREYAPREVYEVSAVKIAEFASAIGAQSPYHYDAHAARQAGYRHVVAPVTFGVVIAQRAEAQFIQDPEAGIDFSRVVHAEQNFSWQRPLQAGDEIETTVHVVNVVQRAGISLVTTKAELHTTSSEHIGTVTSTLAIRGA